MKWNCEVVQDLLPLYHDKVCSEESKKLVEEHLSECANCRAYLDTLDEEITMGGEVDDAKPLISIQMNWSKQKRRALLKGVGIALSICLVLMAAWWGVTSYDFPMDVEDVVVLRVAQLQNGWIQVRITADFNRFSSERIYVAEEQALYEVVKTTILSQSRNLPENIDVNAYQGSWGQFLFDPTDWGFLTDDEVHPVKRYYIGEPNSENAILIWEEGMELPPADEETEQSYAEHFGN